MFGNFTFMISFYSYIKPWDKFFFYYSQMLCTWENEYSEIYIYIYNLKSTKLLNDIAMNLT